MGFSNAVLVEESTDQSLDVSALNDSCLVLLANPMASLWEESDSYVPGWGGFQNALVVDGTRLTLEQEPA